MSDAHDLFTYASRQPFPDAETAIEALEIARADYVEQARVVALKLLEVRPSITINDVREQLPPPKDVDPRVMGAILRKPHFKRIGYVQSDRSTCHARPIAIFIRGDAREAFPLTDDPTGGAI